MNDERVTMNGIYFAHRLSFIVYRQSIFYGYSKTI